MKVVFQVTDNEGVFSEGNATMTFIGQNSAKIEKTVEIGAQTLVEVRLSSEEFSPGEFEVVSIPSAAEARLFNDCEEDLVVAIGDTILSTAGGFTICFEATNETLPGIAQDFLVKYTYALLDTVVHIRFIPFRRLIEVADFVELGSSAPFEFQIEGRFEDNVTVSGIPKQSQLLSDCSQQCLAYR